MHVRQARLADVPAIRAIGRAAHVLTYEPLVGLAAVEEGLARWWSAEAITAAVEQGRILVAEQDTTVVGMSEVDIYNEVPTIWKLYVDPPRQGQGAGSALLKAAVAHFGPSTERVILEYMAGNAKAAAFYERHGFREFRREPKGEGVPDTVWLERIRPPHARSGG